MSSITYEYADGTFEAIVFDATLQEERSASATVFSKAVEKDTNVVFGVLQQPERLTLQVVVSNTPVGPQDLRGVERGVPFNGKVTPIVGGYNVTDDTVDYSYGVTEQTKKASVKQGQAVRSEFKTTSTNALAKTRGTDNKDRLFPVYDALRFVCFNGIRCSVQTDLEDMTDMVISNIGAPRDGTNSITFSISFEKARIVEAHTGQVKKRKKEKAKKSENRAKTPEQAPPKVSYVDALSSRPQQEEAMSLKFSNYLQSGAGGSPL